jgi:HEAT repeat protein
MRLLKSDDLKDRLTAIMMLGEIGDEAALQGIYHWRSEWHHNKCLMLIIAEEDDGPD